MVFSKLKKGGLRRQEAITGVIFIIPFTIGYFLFQFLPFATSFVISFTNTKFSNDFSLIHFIGLSNYHELLSDQDFLHALKVSINYTVLFVPLVIGMGLAAALFINSKIYLRGIIRTAFFLPYISNFIAIAIVWSILLEPDAGPVNMVLKALGMHNPPMWLLNIKTVIPAVVVIVAWQNVGLFMVTFLAALQNVPKELYEACDIDGGSFFTRFWHITWPMISPTTFFLVIMALIMSFQTFTPVQALTQGGPGNATTTLPLNIYREAFNMCRIGYANTQAVILFAIILVVTIIQWIGQKKWVNYV